ncbi:EAL domain-containing protein [Butyrivibrio sp. FCS014]|uniref:EAL domain-containing protein n=1 Tax=Butyrivibrio sp. FCS014 TaxID=1408304 RepID=UPI0004650764|nr:EAL domain-containing protein [Butyrivibrio sp. FCS014]
MPQVYSTRVFFLFVVAAYINIICEIVECAVFLYLVNVNNEFSSLKRTSQNLYVASLLVCAAIISVYVYAKIKYGGKVRKGVVASICVPAIIGITVIMVSRVYYATNDLGDYYNTGPGINFCYFIGFIYIFTTMIIAVAFRKRLNKNDARAIILGLVMWAILALFQFWYKGLQVSSIAIMLMALTLFLTMENPKEYYEKSMPKIRNRDAFQMVLTDWFCYKKHFFIASVIFTGKTNVLSGEDRQVFYDLQSGVAEMADRCIGEAAYLSNWNTLSFFMTDPAKVESLMSVVNNYKDEVANYKLTFSILEIPRHTSQYDEALQVLSYVSQEYVLAQSSPNLVIDEKIIDRMSYRNSIEDVVRQAIKDKAFDVYYQPILNVAEGKFYSAEALVRLRRPSTENFISPEDFIPIAEQCGLVQDIDDLVFEKVCSFIAREDLISYGIKRIEVNLSGNEAVDRQTFGRLRTKMEKYHIPPKFINFEITETAYINNDEAFKDNVRRLKELGSSFSMDDFGSGYSNLLELLKMDYVLVKMDKEFIWNCLDKNKPENLRMLEYSISFLKDYGLHVLAEGIETLEQAQTLIDFGVEYLQGFYYSRPLPESEYVEFLKTQKGDRL